MKVAEQQSRDSGFYEFDRQFRTTDLPMMPSINPEELGDWQNIIHLKDQWVPGLLRWSQQSLGQLMIRSGPGQEEMDDTVQCIKDAGYDNIIEGVHDMNSGYKEGYNSFYTVNVPEENPLWQLGKKFGFLNWSMAFSIQTPYSMTVCHMDHNFEVVNGKKVYHGGFLKDYLNRKIMIAPEDARPGQAFCFGSQVWQNWKAGDVAILKNAMPHYGHNFNEHNRIFLMISGVVDKEWCERYGC
jgi:hypothetical protein